MGALEELVGRWRANPDADTTLALCSYLSVSLDEDLIREVGGSAETWHRDDVEVMLGVGRMYLDADLLAEAQASLVVAGKARPDDARPFRYLGEVLLRRGDAIRAEKVLARAIHLGLTDQDSVLWHDRAVVFVALQKRVGLQAVATEVARTIPKKHSIPPPAYMPLDDSMTEDEVTLPRRQAATAVPQPPTAAAAEPPPAPPLAPVQAPVAAAGAPDPAEFVPPMAPRPMARAEGMTAVVDAPVPDPRLLLEQLSTVGVYEPGGGAAPAWEAAPRVKARGTWVFVVATVLAIAAGGGGYVYSRHVKAERAAEARSIGDEVQKVLAAGALKDIRATDQRLSRMFDLDSRSQRAAKLWLQNRVLGVLIDPGQPRGLDNAIQRCHTLGVPEAEIAYGRIASFLVEGDLAGAAGALSKWDEQAGHQAMYQLTAGAVLERAGDDRAIERYLAARSIDRDLLVAHVMAANAALLKLGPHEAGPILEKTKARLGGRPEAKALGALAWALGDRSQDLPADLVLSSAEIARLPAPLRTNPLFVEAVVASSGGDRTKAAETIGKAIPSTWSPSMAVWLGFLALDVGDERLARRAALRALQFNAVFPRARILASRVALLGGRLDEAKKAIDQLDPQSTEVAVVRAAAAYETLDIGELSDAVDAFGDDSGQPALAALAAARGVAMGAVYPDVEARRKMARPSVPWGELVAIDAALDTGDLDGAQQMLDAWGVAVKRPVYRMRAARLLRYQGKMEEAMEASTDAFRRGTTTPRMLMERVFTLVANDRAEQAKEVVARSPNVLGPMTKWLATLIEAAAGHRATATAKAAQLDLPPEKSPLALKLLAARGLVAARDRRAKGYLRDLAEKNHDHPELAAARKDL